jgi:lysozyme family protein
MNESYDKAFTIILGEEGGYVFDPRDTGGETQWGITWPSLRLAISTGIVAATTTISTLTQDQAKLIYKEFYWTPIKGDQLPWPLCVYVFDSAVNQGVIPAVKMLQRALKQPQDGILGVATLEAATHASSFTCAQFMAYRAMRYQSTKNADIYGVGWLTRIFDVSYKAGLEKDLV